jgi:hypothetical protein
MVVFIDERDAIFVIENCLTVYQYLLKGEKIALNTMELDELVGSKAHPLYDEGIEG